MLLALTAVWPVPGHALEKYGRPLPSIGEIGEEGVARGPEQEEHWFQGYLLSAAFVDNPTFAARPNNTGLVGMRYMLHLETELYKEYLQFYTDQNFFSDRTRGWIRLSEWDATFAFTGSVGNWGWRLQYERDAPLDRRGLRVRRALHHGRQGAHPDLVEAWVADHDAVELFLQRRLDVVRVQRWPVVRHATLILMGTLEGFPYPPATGCGEQSSPSPNAVILTHASYG